MIDCPHRLRTSDATHCEIASDLAGKPVSASDYGCQVCMQNSLPQQVNRTTLALALHEVGFKSEQAKKLKSQHSEHFAPLPVPEYRKNIKPLSFEDRPGYSLKELLKQIGIHEPSNCYCAEYAAQMDRWGYDGCVERRNEIIEHLNSQSISWFDMIKVGLAGYLTTGSLVDEALRRSKP